MNNPAVNNETIVNYLLGSLPHAETERLDELSITDDEFAFALNAAEKDLVDAYARGELTGGQLERFRSYYLVSPLRRHRVDFSQALETLSESHPTEQIATALERFSVGRATPQKRSGWFGGRGFFTTPHLAWQWGFALAAIALLVAGSWLAFENMRLRQQMSQTQSRPEGSGTRAQELRNELERERQAVARTEQELAHAREERLRLEAEQKQAQDSQGATSERNASKQQGPSPTRGVSVASFILTPQMRSVQQMPTISIPGNTNQVTFQLELEPNEYRAYRVSLLSQSNNQTMWRSGRLNAAATGYGKTLRVSFGAGLLKPHAYLLRVSGISANGASEIVGDYPFRVK